MLVKAGLSMMFECLVMVWWCLDDLSNDIDGILVSEDDISWDKLDLNRLTISIEFSTVNFIGNYVWWCLNDSNNEIDEIFNQNS